MAAAVALYCSPLALRGQDLDELLGGAGEAGEMGLEEETRVTQDEAEAQLRAALQEPDAGRRQAALLALLDSLLKYSDIVLLPRDFDRFFAGLTAVSSSEALRVYVPRLLQTGDDLRFDLAAQARLRIGVRLALAAGGTSLEELRGILDCCADFADLEWLLPALGRAGGAAAIPLVMPHRQDAAIIPLGDHQNIRRIPCAAVLACAYAGDEEAFETILEWYEQDVANLPRFAFYVQWARQEGLDPRNSIALRDYCHHRILQAERLLAFRGPVAIPELVSRANERLSASLTSYLMQGLDRASAEGIPEFLPLLRHPSVVVKERVLSVLLERGSAAVEGALRAGVEEMLHSPRGLDRLFAVEAAQGLGDARLWDLARQTIEREPNLAAKRRMLALGTATSERR